MSDIIERFYNRRRFGIQPGLARINKMLSLLGDPQNSFKSVHIAGTNGKGSVCAMLEAMLSASGLKVGLYTSPHLVKFNERMRINGIDISDEELEKIAVEIEQCAELVEKEIGEAPTFFEVATALAFLWFNSYPAQVFMGDTGSLALGGALGGMCILLKKEFLLPIVGGIFFAETLSVIIQVSYFKYTKKKYGEGRRLFKIAPLHHHFEKCGIHESKIVTRFYIIAVMLAIITMATFKVR